MVRKNLFDIFLFSFLQSCVVNSCSKSQNLKRFALFLLSGSVKFSIGYKKFHLNFAICPVWLSLGIFVSGSQFFSNLISVSWLLLSTQIAATRQSHVKLTLLFYISLFVSNLSLAFFSPAVLDILET